MLRIILLSCCAFAFGGCSIHPLPDDVTRLATRQIVHHIRCEARTAIKHAIMDYLRKVERTDFLNRLATNQLPFQELDQHLYELPAKVRANIVKYERAAITYDFTFDITEQNTVAAEVDFVNLLSHGTFAMPSKGINDLQRQTVRLFRVNDNFGELIRLDSCTEDGSPENLMYPVSGTIGLGEMIETFVDLNEYQRLTGTKDTDTVPTMTDTFNFQTTISGSVAPQVTLTPLNHLFRVSGASLTASALRKDIHKVIVAMSLPPLKISQPVPASHGFLGSGAAVPPRPVTAIDRNNSAIDDAINRSIINRLGSSTLN